MTWIIAALAFMVMVTASILLGRVDLVIAFALGSGAGTFLALRIKRR
jgi:hypothetical protein